ncbi:hypothetical protein J3458_004948 [Metarhizium acridum]|uniref:uncharacterized protein n=1 Tax=Metarhizium acridum TaxID=92637 RepID=UPI001C6B5A57|nr:hypothetical protein J3458_004948 [Metarhizium acridum]
MESHDKIQPSLASSFDHPDTQRSNTSGREVRVCLDDGTISSDLVQSIFYYDAKTVTRILDEQPHLVNSNVVNFAESYRSWRLGWIQLDAGSPWPPSPECAKLKKKTEPLLHFAIYAYSCRMGKHYVDSVPDEAVKIVELLVQRGATVGDEKRDTLIGDVCYRQDSAAILELLSRAGADPLGQCITVREELVTAVEIAAKAGGHQSLAWLLDYALSQGKAIDDYIEVLHTAARNAYEKCVLEFLNRGAEKLINRRIQPRFTAWGAACTPPSDPERGDTALTEAIFSTSIHDETLDTNRRQRAWLMDESTARRERVAWKLLEKGAETTIRDYYSNKTLIYGACTWASEELFSRLIDMSGHDLNETFHETADRFPPGPARWGGDGVGYLHIAALYFNAEVVKHLLSRGLKHQTDRFKRTALHWLALSDEEYKWASPSEIYYGEVPENPNIQENPAPAFAVRTATYLIDIGLEDINAQDSFGRTPLHYACANLMSELLSFLVSRDADVSLKDHEGCTPLHLLANGTGMNHPRDCAFPVESTYLCFKAYKKNIDIDAKDSLGRTALLKACKSHAVNVAKLLLAIGADPNVGDNDSCTPLHYAVSFPEWTLSFHSLQNSRRVIPRAEELKIALLSAGADATRQNNQGQTVAEVELKEKLNYQQEMLEMRRIMEQPVKPYMGRGRRTRGIKPADPTTLRQS